MKINRMFAFLSVLVLAAVSCRTLGGPGTPTPIVSPTPAPQDVRVAYLTEIVPDGFVAIASPYVLTILQDYFTTTVNGTVSLVVAIAYTPIQPGERIPEIPPFLAHNADFVPTVLFSNGAQSEASSATHLPCFLDGYTTPMMLQFIISGSRCTSRTDVQTLLLTFPVPANSTRTLALQLDGGQYSIPLP